MKYAPDTVQSRITTSQGPVWLAATALGLVGLWFDGQAPSARPAWPACLGPAATPHPCCKPQPQLQQYLQGQRRGFDLPLDLSAGTAFQQAVWQALLALPPGTPPRTWR